MLTVAGARLRGPISAGFGSRLLRTWTEHTVRALIQKPLRSGQGPSDSVVFGVFGRVCPWFLAGTNLSGAQGPDSSEPGFRARAH